MHPIVTGYRLPITRGRIQDEDCYSEETVMEHSHGMLYQSLNHSDIRILCIDKAFLKPLVKGQTQLN